MLKQNYHSIGMFTIFMTVVFAIGMYQQELALIQNCIHVNSICQHKVSDTPDDGERGSGRALLPGISGLDEKS